MLGHVIPAFKHDPWFRDSCRIRGNQHGDDDLIRIIPVVSSSSSEPYISAKEPYISNTELFIQIFAYIKILFKRTPTFHKSALHFCQYSDLPSNLRKSSRQWRFESSHTGRDILIQRALHFCQIALHFRRKLNVSTKGRYIGSKESYVPSNNYIGR